MSSVTCKQKKNKRVYREHHGEEDLPTKQIGLGTGEEGWGEGIYEGDSLLTFALYSSSSVHFLLPFRSLNMTHTHVIGCVRVGEMGGGKGQHYINNLQKLTYCLRKYN